MMKGYEYQSDFARKYVAQGRAEGLAEGRVEGRAEGRVEGRAEEAARALLTVLRARGLAVSEAFRDRILAEKDPERLERWLEKAAVASSVAAVLDEAN
jgi:post-segregation antitoxin (ccd killing protein)